MTKQSDPLSDYNLKRDFGKTAEPEGKIKKGQSNRFIVQKHSARRLHYDFRLEMDGVLKSWAVTKGPSLNPDDKRLAVRTEDHPLSYATFEGIIPKDEYGGGTVMLWDEGKWSPLKGKSADDLEKGHLHFILHGERMKGEWLLVRMRGKKGEKRENWLLRKIKDEHAGGSDDLVTRELTSVKTGRSMTEIADDGDGGIPFHSKKEEAFNKAMRKAENNNGANKKSAKGKVPGFRKPQLATLADNVPTGNSWLHEIKYDGYRCLLAVAGGRAMVYSRSGKNYTDRFFDIAKAAHALDLPPALIDGEIIKLNKDGNPDFSALQKALKEESGGLTFFAFDLLEQEGEDLASLTTIERKEQLASMLGDSDGPIRFSEHIIGSGEKLLNAMCKAGQEGIISKRVDAPYRSRRTKSWLKIKCTKRQEFVIIGWRESDKKGRAFASLLLGQYESGELVYKGRVGTGFTQDIMGDLAAKMARLTRKTPAADVPKAEARDARWITPNLVAEIAFAEFTTDERVRHASFIGLRSDKKAEDVSPERSSSVEQSQGSPQKVAISSRDRVIFPDAKVTKGGLADYYNEMGGLMLPWIAHRPLSLVRCPQGRAKKCFFQKHHAVSFGEHVKAVPITEKEDGVEDYIYIENVSGILACVQMGTIEFHGWGSRIDPLEKPDRMIFDLDPDEGLDFGDVIKAARDIQRTLSDLALASFAMLSGGKGIHVYVPLSPRAEWPEVKDFARRFATALAQAQPDKYTATMSKEKRKGKIFIDWLRNQRGATSISLYSVRARKNAPVAAPILWDELDDYDSAAHYTIKDIKMLIERANQADLRHWGEKAQKLPDV